MTDMLLRCDDRATHWNTKLLDTRSDSDTIWNTTFKDIAPRPLPHNNDNNNNNDTRWNTTFYAISEQRDQPEDWNTTLSKIERPSDVNDWSVKIEDVPNNPRKTTDWTTGFNTIENDGNNASWDTSLNDVDRGDVEELCDIAQTDMSDMTRQGWLTDVNSINDVETDWQVSVNPIVNHPTNNPLVQG